MIKRSSGTHKYDSEEQRIILLKRLESYKEIIANPLYDCLNSLLGLEFSALSREITDKQREAITKVDFDLYRQISIYNILCRIQRLFEKDKDKLQINNDGWFKKLDICIEGKRIIEDDFDEVRYLHLFQFDFTPKHGKFDLQEFLRTGSHEKANIPSTIIGNISLHEYTECEGQKIKNIECYQRMIEEMENISYGTSADTPVDISDPALFNYPGHFGTCNDDVGLLKYYRDEEIKKCLRIIKYYQNKKGLTDTEKLALEMAQKYHPLLLQELGLTPKEFTTAKTYSDVKIRRLTRQNYNIKNLTHYVE